MKKNSIFYVVVLCMMSLAFFACGGDDDDDPIPVLKVDKTVVDIDADGNMTDNISITAENTDWQVIVVSGNEWLSAYKNGNTLKLFANKYKELDIRNGKLIISATKDPKLSYTISVTQKGTIVGSTYAAFAYHSVPMDWFGVQLGDYDVYRVYRFTSETQCERQDRKGSPTGEFIGSIENCTYVLNYPFIDITYGSEILYGTFVDKNTFRIGYGSNIMEYHKQ